ncbi:MAG: glutamate 5-kinase [Clostridia bacterium]|nr:glutamate 5-kinase [Clostridia bacterium]
MGYFRDSRRIVVKVGTSTLTHSTGHLNLRRIEKLVKVLSDMKNSGIQVVLVSSGAVSAGVAKLGFGTIPDAPEIKQAMAAVGQSELMKIYDKLFSVYGHTVAQILMTKDVLTNPDRKSAAVNTFNRLLEMNCLPIVNENDSVSTDELTKFGGNDILSAHVSTLCEADVLLNLSDVNGLYDSDPRTNPDAKLIDRVETLDESVYAIAGGAGTSRGTGGMIAKLNAAKIVTSVGIPMFILNGEDPEILYTLLDGGHVGTYFCADKRAKASE